MAGTPVGGVLGPARTSELPGPGTGALSFWVVGQSEPGSMPVRPALPARPGPRAYCPTGTQAVATALVATAQS